MNWRRAPETARPQYRAYGTMLLGQILLGALVAFPPPTWVSIGATLVACALCFVGLRRLDDLRAPDGGGPR